jgi:translation elongation factor EF-1alpha
LRQKYQGKWKSPENAYALNVGLIGPVNAGKSELFGALAYRISAVSPKASTTT